MCRQKSKNIDTPRGYPNLQRRISHRIEQMVAVKQSSRPLPEDGNFDQLALAVMRRITAALW
jgi:hypothetical protein